MKVLVVHTAYTVRGGEDEAVRREIELLQAAPEHDVATLLFSNPRSRSRGALDLAQSGGNGASERQLRVVIERFQPDVIHFHNLWFKGSYSLPRIAREAGVPVVCSMHNFRNICASGDFFRDGAPCTECLSGSVFNAVRHRCYRNSAVASGVLATHVAKGNRGVRVANMSARLLVLSEKSRALFLEAGIAESKLLRTNNFVQQPTERPSKPSMSRKFLFVGRDSPEKGLALLLEAWAAFTSRYPTFELVLAGVDQRRHLPSNARALGIVSSDEVALLMGSSRCLVFPSLCFENQPLVIVEALAAGLPVLTHALTSGADLLAEPPSGLVVPRAVVDDFRFGMMQLTDDNLVDKLGSNGVSAYKARHTPQRKLQELDSIYRTAVAESVCAHDLD